MYINAEPNNQKPPLYVQQFFNQSKPPQSQSKQSQLQTPKQIVLPNAYEEDEKRGGHAIILN